MEHELVLRIFLIIGFMAIAAASSVLLKKIHTPYTIGLVIIGFIVAIVAEKLKYSPLADLELTPEIILYLILPTLIYDASINMDLKALRKNLVPILLLAGPGVVLSAGIVGGVLDSFTAMTIGAALLFGALISATDPVAVIAIFSEIKAPRQLGTLVDGESIFNDATAIVLFTIVLSVIKSGVDYSGSMFLGSLFNFLVVLTGGLFIGGLVGLSGGLIIRLQRDNLNLQITISLIMAYISFITADLLHVSGVMSTLAAGIVVSLLSNDVINHENHNQIRSIWDYFSFIANSFVFLLLGLTEAHNFSSPSRLLEGFKLLLLAIPTITIARAVVIFLIIPVYNRFVKDRKVSFPYQAVLFWGGLRGAVPVALVLVIPQSFLWRDVIVHITLGYILFTLLVQGTTIKWLMRTLKIRSDESYFDYHNGISYTLGFPTERLVDIVTLRLIDSFKNEGFFVMNSESDTDKSYLMSRGQTYIALNIENTDLKITADPNDLAYGKQMAYETLVDLSNAVDSLKKLVESPEMQQIVKVEERDQKSQFNLAKYLNKNLIEVFLKGTDKTSIITELVDIAASEGAIKDRDDILAAVFEREESMSTGFKDGVAIPHAKVTCVEKIILVVGIKKEGVDFDSLDGEPAKFFFLIISPKTHVVPHVQLLSEISKKISESSIREQLLMAVDTDEALDILKRK